MERLAVLSMHTSPLAQPGTGDGGGMNVYVRELSAALARSGVSCDVYTRAEHRDAPDVVDVEPGFRLHHVVAGPRGPIAKNRLHEFVDEFSDEVAKRMERSAPPEVIHANYWLSGIAGQDLKHRFGLPLVCTFHTLDRVKAEASPEELDPLDPDRRAHAEAEVIGCSDAVLASCAVEVDQLVDLYAAPPARVAVIAPGVDHAFFSPGDQAQARRATGLGGGGPLLLFVGRIQPLKGADIAVSTLGALVDAGFDRARLVLVGGPSGPNGDDELAALHALVAELGLTGRVTFLPPQRHELLSSFYRAADCCLVPSTSESFGLVALEAAACGTPVIASAVGGLTTIIDDARTGFLVEGRDVDGFARHVIDLAEHPDRARAMAAAAARRARAYTWPDAARSLREIYRSVSSRTPVECG